MATYNVLEVVNKVLNKLGVDSVTAVNETKFSTVLVEYLNDVLTDLSDHGDWPVMRSEVTYAITSVKRDYEVSLGTGHFRNIRTVRCSGKQSFLRPEDCDQICILSASSAKGTPNMYSIISATLENPVIRIHPLSDNNDNIIVTGFKTYQNLDVSAFASVATLTPPWSGPLLVEGLHAKALWHEGGNTETPEFIVASKIYEMDKQKEFSRFTTMTDRTIRFVVRG